MTIDQFREKIYAIVRDEGDPQFDLAPCQELPPGVPEVWADILRASNPRQRLFQRLWHPWRGLLPDTIAELERTVRGVGLLRTDFRPLSLIYVFERETDTPTFRRGYPSAPVVREEAKLLPDEFLHLYKIHDGWTDLYGFMGPLPSNQWYDLSYVLDGEYSPMLPGIRLKDYLIVCNSGGPAYLGFDISKKPPVGLICSPVDPVQVVPDVVGTLDEWMAEDLHDLM